MATGRTRGIQLEAIQDDGEELDRRPPIDAINEELESSILAKMGLGEDAPIDYTLTVSRVSQNADGSAKRGQMAKLFDTDGTQYDSIFDKLYNHYGKGLYRIVLKKNGRIYGQEDCIIETPYGHVLTPIVEPAIPNSVSSDNSLAGVIGAALERQTQLIERILSNPNQQNGSPVDDIVKLATALQAIQPQANKGMSVADMVSLVTLGREFASGGGGGADTNIWDIVKGFASPELIGPVMSAFAASAKAKETEARTLPPPQTIRANPLPQMREQPAAQPIQPNNTQSTVTPEPELSPQSIDPRMIANFVRTLCVGCSKEAPSSLYADFTVDQLPIEMIAQIVDQPDPVAVIAQSAPALTQYILGQRPWFDAYVAMLRESVQQWRQESAEDANDAPANTGLNTGRDTGSFDNTGHNETVHPNGP